MGSPHMRRTCCKSFSTSSHLRRHEASHISSRSYGCFFCDRYFSRIDTARRHATKCPQRGGRPMPRTLKRGKPRKSCDHCAMAKIACDKDLPCEACMSNSLACTYSRIATLSQPNSPRLPHLSPSDEEENAAGTRECQVSPASPEPMNISQKLKIPFLLNFYRESNSCRDLYTALESGRPQPGQRCRSPNSAEPSEFDVVLPEVVWPSLPEESIESFSFFGSFGVDPWSQKAVDDGSSEHMARSQASSFREQAEEIVNELKLTANCSGKSIEGAQDHFDSAINQGLFSVTNLFEHTRLYLQYFRRHCPIIDLPMSRVSSVSLPLLLAIFLGGSILSYPRDTYHLAIECFDLAEEYIFGLSIFKVGCKYHGALEQQVPDLVEPLMAAIIMINFQMGRNDTKVRRRIRSQRFPALVYAARSLSLFQLGHQNASLQPALNSSVSKQRESLIRTATYIFLLDCQFTACTKSPPLMTVAELTGDLPCHEVQFSVDESFPPAFSASHRSPSLVGFIDILMDDSRERLGDILLHTVSMFGLFTVICALHSLVFSAYASMTVDHQASRLERALSRWHTLWKNVLSLTSKAELELIGFKRCAEEIWLLARALLQTNYKDFIKGLDSDSMLSFNTMIRRVHEISSIQTHDLD